MATAVLAARVAFKDIASLRRQGVTHVEGVVVVRRQFVMKIQVNVVNVM